MDKRVKEIWHDEFKYLYHNKILSRDEFGYLLTQIKQLLSEKEKEIETYKDAIHAAQKENPDEVHCSCVPLLKARIKELETDLKYARDELERQKTLIPWIGELAQARVKIKELEEALTIKILENAKGAQILSNVEENVKELEKELERLLRKVNCVTA